MIGKIFNVEVIPEFKNSVIHNHFDCPVCDNEAAGIDIYGQIIHIAGYIFHCENCGAEFEIVNDEDFLVGDFEVRCLNDEKTY